MSVTNSALNEILRHPGIWRRSAPVSPSLRTVPSQCAELDAMLPGSGWPIGTLSEILLANDGLGELSLVIPALAELTRQRRRVVFISPPYIPYAPALVAHGIDLNYVTHIDAGEADGAWSAEQCLRSGGCGAVLFWLHKAEYAQLRRLQLAAETGGCIGFLFRPIGAASNASPSGLRLRVQSDGFATHIDILKCRGRIETPAQEANSAEPAGQRPVSAGNRQDQKERRAPLTSNGDQRRRLSNINPGGFVFRDSSL
ncbi:MAG: translesion DNA synthesis-associated protein ImuA [Tahibacter sp.]